MRQIETSPAKSGFTVFFSTVLPLKFKYFPAQVLFTSHGGQTNAASDPSPKCPDIWR